MSDWIYAQDPDGVTQRARPGTPLPEGWSLIEERTPPTDMDAEGRTPPRPEGFGEMVGNQFVSALGSMVDPQSYVAQFKDSTKVLPLLGALLGPVGAGVGEAARQSLAGEEPSAGGVAGAAGGTAVGGALLGALSKAGRVVGGAARGGAMASEGIESALATGERIPADKVMAALQTLMERGLLTGAKKKAAEAAMGAPVGAAGPHALPIDKIDALRHIGGGMAKGRGKMLVGAVKGGLEDAGTPGAEQLLQALSDFAVRKRLTQGFTSPLSLMDVFTAGTGRFGRAGYRANQALRPSPMDAAATRAGGLGGYGLSEVLEALLPKQ